MEFRKVSRIKLMECVGWDTYVGGSNEVDEQEFFAYVRGKYVSLATLTPAEKLAGLGNVEWPAVDVFSTCYYRDTTNARFAENELLDCGPTRWNVLGSSGLQDAPGFVYVLVK